MRDYEVSELENNAAMFATKAHSHTNHKYDFHPYRVHLEMVADTAAKFIDLVPEENRDEVMAAAWLHDTIEDCRLTYNDIRKEFGVGVAELVYALTNEKGRGRKDRANAKYYEGIRSTHGAIFLKLADRIANVEYSKSKGSRMFDCYEEEHEHFVMALWGNHDHPMIQHLDNLFND